MNIFVPYNIQSRVEKLRQANFKMLQNEVLDCTQLEINDNFNFKADQVKVTTIIGYVYLIDNLGYIPEWLKNVTIDGTLCINNCKLTSLKNCPQYIKGSFDCENNYLTSLEGGPKYVGGYFDCNSNRLISIEGCPEFVGRSFRCRYNRAIFESTEILNKCKVGGNLYL